MARHASPVQSLLVDDRFDGDVYAREPLTSPHHLPHRRPGALLRAARIPWGRSRGWSMCAQPTGTPWVVLGRGSNVLVADEGFPGVAVALGRDLPHPAASTGIGFCRGRGRARSPRWCRRPSSRAHRRLRVRRGHPGHHGRRPAHERRHSRRVDRRSVSFPSPPTGPGRGLVAAPRRRDRAGATARAPLRRTR